MQSATVGARAQGVAEGCEKKWLGMSWIGSEILRKSCEKMWNWNGKFAGYVRGLSVQGLLPVLKLSMRTGSYLECLSMGSKHHALPPGHVSSVTTESRNWVTIVRCKHVVKKLKTASLTFAESDFNAKPAAQSWMDAWGRLSLHEAPSLKQNSVNPVTVHILTYTFHALLIHFMYIQFSNILICSRWSTWSLGHEAGNFSLPSSHIMHLLHLAAIPGQESCLNNTSALRQYIKHEALPQSRIDTSLRNVTAED